MSNEEKVVLIDTDAGLDDAWAIIMAIKAHLDPQIKFRIVGITCVHGNTSVNNVTLNVSTIMDQLQITDIPIYRGAAYPMVTLPESCSKARHHGGDGFGDVEEHLLKKTFPKVESENAVSATIRLANEYSRRLSIVALGPLTNLGLAVRADDRIKDKIKDIFIMGGNTKGGNALPCAEFNFRCDPESVHVTLTTFSCPILISPMEIGWNVVGQSPMAGYVVRLQANRKVLAEQEIYNVYIRLLRCVDSLNEFHFYIAVGGYLLDDIQLSRFSSNELVMRQLARRLARNLGVNYFDYEDVSAKHIIYHYKGYSRQLWQRADLASLFAIPWGSVNEEERQLRTSRAFRKKVLDRAAHEELTRKSTVFHEVRRGSEGAPGGRRGSQEAKPKHTQ